MKKLRQIIENHFTDDYRQSRLNTDSLHDNLVHHYKWSIDTSDQINQHDELNDYTKKSHHLNSHLWDMHQGDEGAKAEHSEFTHSIKHMDSALNKHKTPDSMTVYSGTHYDPRNKMNDKKIIHHPAYLSTSLKMRTAHAFSSTVKKGSENQLHIMAIHVPKDHPGAYVDHISGNSNEREFILPRGTKLKHAFTTKEKTYPKDKEEINRYTYIHHMDVV